jgi:nucleotidyltransferase/DNA polymerase involved in DNA repair
LEQALGRRAAESFSRLAHGIDPREIGGETLDKSISNETTFPEDTTDRPRIEATYKALIDKVAARLRAAELFATTVHLRLRWSDFSTITRQTRLVVPACDDITLREAGMVLLDEHRQDRPVRLIGFGVSGLVETDQPHSFQLNLFDAPDTALHEKRHRLSQTADTIRQKYGSQSIRRASSLESE